MDATAKVIFIDDDQSACRSWLSYFQDTSYRCSTFSDAREALEQLACGGAQLIVTDLLMPGMKGAEMLRKIRKLDEDVPVIIVTACANVDSLIETAKANALEPWAYLNYLFERLPAAKTPAAIEALLPHNLKNDDLKL